MPRIHTMTILKIPKTGLVNKVASFNFVSSFATPDLHSFPTRRSSDLVRARRRGRDAVRARARTRGAAGAARRQRAAHGDPQIGRAHAELQSRRDLVCRLLLEKKNI